VSIPKDLTQNYFPGLGDQHVIGMSGLGYSVVTATLTVNTSQTDAQVIASPPNTSAGAATGPIVHSLGTPPSAVIPMMATSPGAGGLGWSIQMQYITADNSAVYLRAFSWTGTTTRGQAVRLIAIR